MPWNSFGVCHVSLSVLNFELAKQNQCLMPSYTQFLTKPTESFLTSVAINVLQDEIR